MRFCVTRQAATPFFALGHRSAVTDEAGAPRYRVADRLSADTAPAALRDTSG